MYGIGVDTTTISRIKKSLERESFLHFVYGENEIALFYNDKINYNSLAANFAAKEAFSKALGTGVVGFSLNEVEILRNENNAPYFKLSGKAKNIIDNLNIEPFISLTHEKDIATAFVILYNFWQYKETVWNKLIN